jgi:hypothetical protein
LEHLETRVTPGPFTNIEALAELLMSLPHLADLPSLVIDNQFTSQAFDNPAVKQSLRPQTKTRLRDHFGGRVRWLWE